MPPQEKKESISTKDTCSDALFCLEHYREIGALGDLELIQQKVAALVTKGNILERDNLKAIDALRLFLVVSFEKQSGVVTERAVAHAWRVIVGTGGTQLFAWLKLADGSFVESGSDELTVGLDNVAMESLQRPGLHLGWEFARVMLDEAECNALDIVNVFRPVILKRHSRPTR